MDLKLNNKVAIVLAASKGLGKAIALALSAEGAKVIIGSRDADALNKTAAEIMQVTQNDVIPIPVDVADAEQVTQFINKAADTFGRIDILLNNAGGPPFDKFENFDDEQWQKAFETEFVEYGAHQPFGNATSAKNRQWPYYQYYKWFCKISIGWLSAINRYADGRSRYGKTDGR